MTEGTTSANLPGANKLHEYLKKTMIDGSFGAILLFDIDGFHEFNVERGVEAGDQVIASIEEYIDAGGWVGFRIGGDEFGIVIEEHADSFDDEEFRVGLKQLLREKVGFQVTISGGGVWHPGDDFNIDSRLDEAIFATAHGLLQKAKQEGRDRIFWLPRGPVEAIDVMSIMVRFYEEMARVNSSLARELEIESRVDFLTGLANRRGFEDVFKRMTESAQRSGQPLALIYMDSDSLKKINDSRGHDAGDRFIIDIARVLGQVVRGSDFISRWGADEFAVLMDNASSEEKVKILANRIHHAIETRTEGTISMGVYCGIPETAEDAVRQADRALYRAKELGKNRVEFACGEAG